MINRRSYVGWIALAILASGCSGFRAAHGGVQLLATGPPAGSELARALLATYRADTGIGIRFADPAGYDPVYLLQHGEADLLFDGSPPPVLEGLMAVPIGDERFAVVYRLDSLNGPLHLNESAVQGICDGSVKWWNDPAIRACNYGATLPHSTISIIGSDRADHAADALAQYATLFGRVADRRLVRRTVRQAVGYSPAATVALNDGALAVVSIADASRCAVDRAEIETVAGEYARAGAQTDAYPIERTCYMDMRVPLKPALLQFATWCLTNAQEADRACGLSPTPAARRRQLIGALGR
ncbi:MAG: type 2 periplasmic-binding domain-containing protein [Fimbriimonadaceae bacterium]